MKTRAPLFAAMNNVASHARWMSAAAVFALVAGCATGPNANPADPFEELVGVRDARQPRGPRPSDQVPVAGVDDGEVAEDEAGPTREVAVDHREPVAVVDRQAGHRAVAVGERERLDDRGRVAVEVVVRQPHQLGRPRRPGGREQQRQVGVQVVLGRVVLGRDRPGRTGPLHHAPRAVALDQPGHVVRPVAGDEQHHVPTAQGGQIGDQPVDSVLGRHEDQLAGG